MKIALIIILSLIALLLLTYNHLGGFKKINISIIESGRETIAYKTIKGDYKQVGIVMDEVYYKLLNKYKITTYKGFAKYFDHPKNTSKENLRSEAGCIIEPNNIQNLNTIQEELKIRTIESKQYIYTEFPYQGKLSVLLSIIKIYPALERYAKQHNAQEFSPIEEIYDIPNKKIYYRKEFIINK
jgi:hypothetical protein